MRFKEFLNESSDKEIRATIAEWRKELNGSKQYNYHPFGKFSIVDGKIRHESPKLIIHDFMCENGKLAIPFYSAQRIEIFIKDHSNLTTFENFPEHIMFKQTGRLRNMFDKNFDSSYELPLLKSIEHFPRYISGDVSTFKLHNLNLSRCNKHISELNGKWSISREYVGPIMSTILIPGIQEVLTFTKEMDEILNRHLKGDKDILDLQEELVQAGYKEFAKL